MSAVWLVGVTELRGSADDAAKELAPALGTTAYELRLNLAIGTPTVVLFTPEETRAKAVCAAFERAGHRAVVCLRSEVVPSGSMTPLKDFRFDPSGLVANVSADAMLPYADILLLARATHRVTTETTVEVKERKLRPGMAIATGGLVLSKVTTKEVVSKSEEREQVLYLFRRSGAPAWILRERGARYGGLGAEAARTSLENFGTVVRKLRDTAPGAVFDERLLGSRPVRGVPDAILSVDLLAHVMARDVAAL